MKSMTGYGRAELLLPDYSGVIEVSSVNKRGFEFLLHGPKEWQFFEKKALSIVRTFAERGRIRLAILLNPPSIQHTDHLTDQLSKIQEQLDVIQNICKQSKVPYSPSTDLIQRILFSISKESNVPTLDMVENQLIQSTQLALTQMNSMREQEGKSLMKDLSKRAKSLRKIVAKIDQQTSGQAKEWRDRLLNRLKQSGLQIDCENEAVRKEFTVFSEKSDISEEIIRILSHLDQFESTLQSNHPIGRKLEFIVQEIGREFNTLGSKSIQSKVSNFVIEAKVEIEKIREQIMNLE